MAWRHALLGASAVLAAFSLAMSVLPESETAVPAMTSAGTGSTPSVGGTSPVSPSSTQPAAVSKDARISGVAWPSDAGRPPSPELVTMRSWCEAAAVVDAECSFAYFQDLTRSKGWRDAVMLIEEMNDTDVLFQAECHHSYHGVGQTLPELMPITDALAAVPDVACQGGMVHGVVQTWSLHASDELVAAEAGSICLAFPTGSPRQNFCGHGVGHAIGVHFPSSLVAAAAVCDTAANDGIADACIDGLVMEFGGTDFVTKEISAQLGKPRAKDLISAEERRTACNQIPERLRDRCAYKVFQLWTDVWEDLPALAERCMTLLTVTRQQNCAYSIGEVIATRHMEVSWSSSPASIAAAAADCEQIPAGMVDRCVEGMISVMWRDVPLSQDAPESLCSAMPPQLLPGCRRGDEYGFELRQAS